MTDTSERFRLHPSMERYVARGPSRALNSIGRQHLHAANRFSDAAARALAASSLGQFQAVGRSASVLLGRSFVDSGVFKDFNKVGAAVLASYAPMLDSIAARNLRVLHNYSEAFTGMSALTRQIAGIYGDEWSRAFRTPAVEALAKAAATWAPVADEDIAEVPWLVDVGPMDMAPTPDEEWFLGAWTALARELWAWMHTRQAKSFYAVVGLALLLSVWVPIRLGRPDLASAVLDSLVLIDFILTLVIIASGPKR